VIFYEQLVHDPEVLVHLQRFLGLPVRQLQSIEKKSSQRASIDWLGPYFAPVNRYFATQASNLLEKMLNNPHFDTEFDIAHHFREICGTKPKSNRANFYWMGVSCADVAVIEDYTEN
jgi:hypothetical protein